jgi:hypothetical protein
MRERYRRVRVLGSRAMAKPPIRSVRKLPWQAILAVAVQVAQEGRRRWDRLSTREQQELQRLIRRSKGLPNNLKPSEREQLRRIVWKAAGPQR